MPTSDIVSAIRDEIARLEQALSALQGLSTLPTVPPKAKRGRPPGKTAAKTPPVKQKRTMTEEGRARIAATQKTRWAAKKIAEKNAVKAAASPLAKKKSATPLKKTAAKKSAVPMKRAVKKAVRPAKKVRVERSVPTRISFKSRAGTAKQVALQPITPEISQRTTSDASSDE